MKTEESKALGAVAGIGAIVVIAGVISHTKVVRAERKKRKQIEEWETTAKSAIAASRARLERMINDPNTTAADLLQAWLEENEFMKLIRDQPMY